MGISMPGGVTAIAASRDSQARFSMHYKETIADFKTGGEWNCTGQLMTLVINKHAVRR